jgi:uncharacterized protein
MEQEKDQESLELVRGAAQRGVHQAQLILGQMLLDGRLLERNTQQALYWFERAAKGGNLMAVNMVGRCFDQGWGVVCNKVLAERWFRTAAERGLDWGMYNLATLLALGEGGVCQDRVAAFYWLRQAVELGHVKSINILGGFYEDGWVVRKDREVARAHYRQAALGGDFRGQFNFARFLIQEGDLGGALYWLGQVPSSATPAFLRKMKEFLSQMSHTAIREFVSTLDGALSEGNRC